MAIRLLNRLQLVKSASLSYNIAWEAAAMNDENPFASPQTSNEDYVPELAILDDAERIRRQFLSRENNIRTLGGITILGCVLLLVLAIGIISSAIELPLGVLELVIISGVCLGLSVVHGWVGYGLMKLNPKVRLPAIALCIPWMFYFGIATIISIMSLIALTGEKGKYVFSMQYKEIIAITPDVKLKMSKVVTFLLIAMLIIGIVGLIAGLSLRTLTTSSSFPD